MSESQSTQSHLPTASSLPTASAGTQDLRSKAASAMSTLSDAAQGAVGEAKKTASSLASEAAELANGAAQKQIASGADLIGHVAASTRAAADNLDPNAPQIAGFVRDAGDRIDEFSRSLRNRSVDELIETSSDFARRQPAVLFGAAAACGFVLYRLFKAASSSANGPQQGAGGSPRPGGPYTSAESPSITSGQFHGP
jgi:ElaB/YqjD/DUF883 family membrane-anchored ribosome-binding protein